MIITGGGTAPAGLRVALLIRGNARQEARKSVHAMERSDATLGCVLIRTVTRLGLSPGRAGQRSHGHSELPRWVVSGPLVIRHTDKSGAQVLPDLTDA